MMKASPITGDTPINMSASAPSISPTSMVAAMSSLKAEKDNGMREIAQGLEGVSFKMGEVGTKLGSLPQMLSTALSSMLSFLLGASISHTKNPSNDPSGSYIHQKDQYARLTAMSTNYKPTGHLSTSQIPRTMSMPIYNLPTNITESLTPLAPYHLTPTEVRANRMPSLSSIGDAVSETSFGLGIGSLLGAIPGGRFLTTPAGIAKAVSSVAKGDEKGALSGVGLAAGGLLPVAGMAMGGSVGALTGLALSALPAMLKGISGWDTTKNAQRVFSSLMPRGMSSGLSGMGPNMNQALGMRQALRGSAAESKYFNLDESKEMMVDFINMDLMGTTRTTDQFKAKFDQLLKTTRQVAGALHTSVKDATKIMADLDRQGYSVSDMASTSYKIKYAAESLGTSGTNLAEMVQQGTAVASQKGYSPRVGTNLGIQAASAFGEMYRTSSGYAKLVEDYGGREKALSEITGIYTHIATDTAKPYIQAAFENTDDGYKFSQEKYREILSGAMSESEVIRQSALVGAVVPDSDINQAMNSLNDRDFQLLMRRFSSESAIHGIPQLAGESKEQAFGNWLQEKYQINNPVATQFITGMSMSDNPFQGKSLLNAAEFQASLDQMLDDATFSFSRMFGRMGDSLRKTFVDPIQTALTSVGEGVSKWTREITTGTFNTPSVQQRAGAVTTSISLTDPTEIDYTNQIVRDMDNSMTAFTLAPPGLYPTPTPVNRNLLDRSEAQDNMYRATLTPPSRAELPEQYKNSVASVTRELASFGLGELYTKGDEELEGTISNLAYLNQAKLADMTEKEQHEFLAKETKKFTLNKSYGGNMATSQSGTSGVKPRTSGGMPEWLRQLVLLPVGGGHYQNEVSTPEQEVSANLLEGYNVDEIKTNSDIERKGLVVAATLSAAMGFSKLQSPEHFAGVFNTQKSYKELTNLMGVSVKSASKTKQDRDRVAQNLQTITKDQYYNMSDEDRAHVQNQVGYLQLTEDARAGKIAGTLGINSYEVASQLLLSPDRRENLNTYETVVKPEARARRQTKMDILRNVKFTSEEEATIQSALSGELDKEQALALSKVLTATGREVDSMAIQKKYDIMPLEVDNATIASSGLNKNTINTVEENYTDYSRRSPNDVVYTTTKENYQNYEQNRKEVVQDQLSDLYLYGDKEKAEEIAQKLNINLEELVSKEPATAPSEFILNGISVDNIISTGKVRPIEAEAEEVLTGMSGAEHMHPLLDWLSGGDYRYTQDALRLNLGESGFSDIAVESVLSQIDSQDLSERDKTLVSEALSDPELAYSLSKSEEAELQPAKAAFQLVQASLMDYEPSSNRQVLQNALDMYRKNSSNVKKYEKFSERTIKDWIITKNKLSSEYKSKAGESFVEGILTSEDPEAIRYQMNLLDTLDIKTKLKDSNLTEEERAELTSKLDDKTLKSRAILTSLVKNDGALNTQQKKHSAIKSLHESVIDSYSEGWAAMPVPYSESPGSLFAWGFHTQGEETQGHQRNLTAARMGLDTSGMGISFYQMGLGSGAVNRVLEEGFSIEGEKDFRSWEKTFAASPAFSKDTKSFSEVYESLSGKKDLSSEERVALTKKLEKSGVSKEAINKNINTLDYGSVNEVESFVSKMYENLVRSRSTLTLTDLPKKAGDLEILSEDILKNNLQGASLELTGKSVSDKDMLSSLGPVEGLSSSLVENTSQLENLNEAIRAMSSGQNQLADKVSRIAEQTITLANTVDKVADKVEGTKAPKFDTWGYSY